MTGNHPGRQSSAAELLTVQLLAWLAARPRSYADTMDAWRSTCPRLSIWEDALGDGLVALQSGGAHGMRETRVVLTDEGWAKLAAGEGLVASAERLRA